QRILDTDVRREFSFESIDVRTERSDPIRVERFEQKAAFFAADVRRRKINLVHVQRFLSRAGMPTTVAPSRTSRVTTAPAPTIARSPTRRYCRTCAPLPMRTSSPISTPPEMFAPGITTLARPMRDSWP